MSGATGGDCVSDGCDGLFESERRSPSGAAADALAGACVLRGRGIGRLARALRCAANAASMSIDKSIDKSIGVSTDALIGLPTGLSASLSAPDLSAPAGSSTPSGLAEDDIGSADADTPRPSLVPGDVVPGDAPPDVTPLTSPSSWTGVLDKTSPLSDPPRTIPSRAWPHTNPAQRCSRSWLHLTKSLKRRSRSSSLPGAFTPRRLLTNSLN